MVEVDTVAVVDTVADTAKSSLFRSRDCAVASDPCGGKEFY